MAAIGEGQGAALLVAMPYILFQIWSFIAPGLYRHEKRFAVPMFVSSVVLFYTGILDLQRLPQMEIADPVGLVQSQALINGSESLRVVLNGSSSSSGSAVRRAATGFAPP